MGNLYRFVEPVVLLLLKKKGRSYGYDLSADLQAYALTDAEIERAALYRVLHQLEENGNVTSEWDVEEAGPARHVYTLTAKGEAHLDEWATVLEQVSKSMARFVRAARSMQRTTVPHRVSRRRAASRTRPHPRSRNGGAAQ
jgi:DNA-binding PadR family transcriptional regulator